MSSTGNGRPPAGWYADPGNPAGLRYWDGSRWSEHRAAVSGQPGPRPPDAVPPAGPATGRSWGLLPWLVAGIALVVVVALVAVVVVLLRRDGGSVAGPVASPSASAAASSSEPAPTPTASGEATPEPTGSEAAPEPTGSDATTAFAFDEPIEYEGGLTITLTNPTQFTPSPEAAGYEDGQTALRFDVVVENWSEEAYDAYDFTVMANAGADEAACNFIGDVEQDLTGAPQEIVSSMSSTSFAWGFACDAAAGEPLWLSVSPGVAQDFALATVEGTVPQ